MTRIIDLVKIAANEELAEEMLRTIGVLKSFNNCVYCNKLIYRIRRNKVKCSICKREWNRRKGSILENLRISYSEFLLIVKLHELNLPISRIRQEVNLAEDTVSRVIQILYEKIRSNFGIEHNYTFTKITLIEEGDCIMPILETDVVQKSDSLEVKFSRSKNALNQYQYKLEYVFSSKVPGKISSLHRFISFLEKNITRLSKRELRIMNNIFLDVIFRYNCSRSKNFENSLFYLVADNRVPCEKR